MPRLLRLDIVCAWLHAVSGQALELSIDAMLSLCLSLEVCSSLLLACAPRLCGLGKVAVHMRLTISSQTWTSMVQRDLQGKHLSVCLD